MTVQSGTGVSRYRAVTTWPRTSRASRACSCSRPTSPIIRSELSLRRCSGRSVRSTRAEITEKAYRSIAPNSIIGQSGLEAQYNSYLSGTQGSEQVQVDARGSPPGVVLDDEPEPGQNLRLSLDAHLERVGQNALQESIGLNARPRRRLRRDEPTTGAVYAMGSLPSFDPSIFTGNNLSESAYKALISPAAASR